MIRVHNYIRKDGVEVCKACGKVRNRDDGDQCASCGMPGWVSVDEPDPDDADVYWVVSDADWARCKQADCESCASAAEGA